MKPARGYEALRRGRVTIPGATYFVTICTKNRSPGLSAEAPAKRIRDVLTTMHVSRALELRAWVIMSDHVHLLFVLTETLRLGQVVGRVKTQTRAALIEAGLAWQGNYFEHRLRPGDNVEDVLQYIYLNPYRSHLAAPSDQYPHFWLRQEDAEWFRTTLDDDRPFPQWLCRP